MNAKALIRMMLSNKKQHIINILGLSIGLTVVLLISLYLRTEYMFDKHLSNCENKYRILQIDSDQRKAIFPYQVGELIRHKMPEVELLCMVTSEHGKVKVDNETFYISNVLVSDSSFIMMFDLKIVAGKQTNLINEPNTCIISRSTAEKIFGKESAIDKTIHVAEGAEIIVQAIFDDLPATSHLEADILLAMSTWRSNPSFNRFFSDWNYQAINMYLTLHANSHTNQVEHDIKQVIKTNGPWYSQEDETTPNAASGIKLQAMQDIHLYSSDIQWDANIVKNTPVTLQAFAIVMILVILLACFNYINLSTANSEHKTKITSILTSMGAKRSQIFNFYFTQTLVIGFISIVCALLLSVYLLSFFENLLGCQLHFSTLYHKQVLPLFILAFVGIILLTGLYPALYASQAIKVGAFQKEQKKRVKKNKQYLRSSLVTLQFVVAVFLLTCLFTIRQQIIFLTGENLGFDKSYLLEIDFFRDQKAYDMFSQELKKLACVQDVTAASNMPGEYINNQNRLTVVGETPKNPPSGCLVGVENNYFKIMNTQILEGEGFTDKLTSYENKVLINQTAVQQLNLINPIGISLELMGRKFSVIGVVEDVQYRTLHEPALPVLYANDFQNHRKIAIRLHPGSPSIAIEQIKSIYAKAYPDEQLELNFFDTKLSQNYETEIRQIQLFNILVIIGVLIMVLGLLGLIGYMAERRSKEIGVRKVHGAKISEILILFNADFIRWGFIAFLISTPLSYYAMSRWLENFAYRTELSWWIFALAAMIALSVALLTVSWQSWRAATRNPVHTLRHE